MIHILFGSKVFDLLIVHKYLYISIWWGTYVNFDDAGKSSEKTGKDFSLHVSWKVEPWKWSINPQHFWQSSCQRCFYIYLWKRNWKRVGFRYTAFCCWLNVVWRETKQEQQNRIYRCCREEDLFALFQWCLEFFFSKLFSLTQTDRLTDM